MAKGDHLAVWRGTYLHHGIDIGLELVIHFPGSYWPLEWARQRVDIVSKAVFKDKGVMVVVPHLKPDPARIVLARAASQLGRSGYHLKDSNCEHFATWCATGEWRSSQVDIVRSLLIAGTTSYIF